MNKIVVYTRLIALSMVALLFAGCTEYLNEIPKGQAIPVTWNDFNNFLKNEYFDGYNSEMGQVYVLMNDVYRTPTQLNTKLTSANYNWDESINRADENTSDYFLYTNNYSGVFYANLIIEEADKMTECTEEQRLMIKAQAHMLRAMFYFHVANYHADQYSAATVDKPSIPLVTSSSVEAPSPQVTIGELYDFILDDLHASLEHLPLVGETYHHPTKVAGYGMLARVYLSMSDYENALKYADMALGMNDALFDWIAYYEADAARYAEPAPGFPSSSYSTQCKPMAKTNPENYIFRYGSANDWSGISGKSMGIPLHRAARFEEGDARLRTHWKRRYYANTNEDLYFGIHGEMVNVGGITSPEMYYIKAECLARKGGASNINAAMDLLNTVRKTRIFPEFYADATASTTKEAVNKIIDEKANEYIQTMIPFWDLRRLNKDPEYARTLTKEVGGKTVSLKPDSHLWIMPFASRILLNPGNGTIVQNTPR